MNTKFRKTLYAVTLAPLLLGSVGAVADTADNNKAARIAQAETRDQAHMANREAVTDALARISAATRLDLDVELPARASTVASGD